MSATKYKSREIRAAGKGSRGLPATWNVKTGIVALYFKGGIGHFLKFLMNICRIGKTEKKKRKDKGGHAGPKKAGKLGK